MTTSYEDFLPEVLPRVPDCPEIVAVNAIRNATIEFCDKTEWLRYDMDTTTVQAGVGSIDLELPAGMVFGRIVQAYLDDRKLEAATVDALAKMFAGSDWRQATGAPTYITHVDGETVLLVPAPMEAGGVLKLLLTLKPARDSTGCADDLYEHFLEEIAAGALARLYMTKGQPYYDPSSGAMAAALFASAISDTKRERMRDLGRPVQTIRPPRFV